MGRKGRRSVKGVPLTDWGEPKTKQLSVSMTQQGYLNLRSRVEELNWSVAEVLERWARRQPVDTVGANKGGSHTTIPNPAVLDAEAIIKALPNLSLYQIGRISLICLSLLMLTSRRETKDARSIRDIVKEYKQVVLAMFTDVISNPEERINKIIEGDKPSKEELSLLVGVLPLTQEQLMEIYQKEFGSGDESANGCDLRLLI